MCDFCEGRKDLHSMSTKLGKRDSCTGIYAGVYSTGVLMIEASPDTWEPSYMEADIEINYCPMCGEKLREGGQQNGI